MTTTWLYGERVRSVARHHVISEQGHDRVVEFWWDLRFLNDRRFTVCCGDTSVLVYVWAFQQDPSPVSDQPKLWIVTSVSAESESEAVRIGARAIAFAAGTVGLVTRLPFQPTGDFRIIRVATVEHGFMADFDGDELRGFTVLLESPDAGVKPIPSWNSPRLLMAYAAFFFDVVVSIFSSRFIASRSLGRCR